MNLVQLIFREVNIVLVHAGIAVPSISLDRVREARPAASMQVTSAPGLLVINYPDERLTVQFDPQRISANDSSNRPPESSSIVDAVLAQHKAAGGIPVVAFGYNIRFDFEVEGMDSPGEVLTRAVVRDQPSINDALRTDSSQLGMNFLYRRGLKIWTFRIEPVAGAPQRIMVHANIHEDLKPPGAPEPPVGLPAPQWLEQGGMEMLGAGLPGPEGMKADLANQARATLETAASLLSMAARG